MSFCATCLDEHIDLRARPLGRNGALVLVCPDCDPNDTAQQKRRGPVFRGYDVPDRTKPIGPTLPAFARAANRIAPTAVSVTPSRYSGSKTTPGFVRVSVPRRINGKNIDRTEARRTLSHEPWYAELKHVGTDSRFHVFERPDVELAREIRSKTADGRNAMDRLKDEIEGAKR